MPWRNRAARSFLILLSAGLQVSAFAPVQSSKGRVWVIPANSPPPPAAISQNAKIVRIVEGGEAWGDGTHPTTRLMLDFLEETIHPGIKLLDYGTGTGILSLVAVQLGAAEAIGVDVDSEVLLSAQENLEINGACEMVKLHHTREVQVGDRWIEGDVVVANILTGPLRRLMPVLCLAVKDGGILALSGFRQADVPVIEREYGNYIEWQSSRSATHPEWGPWIIMIGRPRPGGKKQLLDILSDAALM
jgi:ribosomal protein L11 methyltransferase